MAGCCSSCSRPLVLSEEETCLLRAAAQRPVAVDEAGRACARVLKRMGYLVRLNEGLYAITEHGRRRLAEMAGGGGRGCAPQSPGAGASLASS